MESIKAIQAQNIYRVNPVTFFEQKKPQQKNNIFSQVSGFNLNHPSAQNAFTANNLDLLA